MAAAGVGQHGGAVGGGLRCCRNRRLHTASPRLPAFALRVTCLRDTADFGLDQFQPHVTP